jgi:hypothetical protein
MGPRVSSCLSNLGTDERGFVKCCIWELYWNVLTDIFNSLTELSPSWGSANCADTQELPRILWNPKVYYRVHKSPPLVTILSYISPIHTIPSYLRSILILSIPLRLSLPRGVWGSGCIDPHCLDLGTSWMWVVSFTPLPLYPRGKSPRYTLVRRLGGPQSQSGRSGEEKILIPSVARTPIPRLSSP